MCWTRVLGTSGRLKDHSKVGAIVIFINKNNNLIAFSWCGLLLVCIEFNTILIGAFATRCAKALVSWVEWFVSLSLRCI
jgi:hypothetical protein